MNTEIPDNSHLEIVHMRVDGVRLREREREGERERLVEVCRLYLGEKTISEEGRVIKVSRSNKYEDLPACSFRW